MSVAIEHFQKRWPTAKPPKPSDFYGPGGHMRLWNCVGHGDGTVGLCHEGDKDERRRRGARLNFLLLLYWDTSANNKNVCA